MLADPHVPDNEALRGVETDLVAIEGDSLHYLQSGDDGPPVVLLHGGNIDAAHISWAPQFDRLVGEVQLFVPNLCGYGPNPVPENPLSIPKHARVVGEFMETLDLNGAVVAGISLGGGVAVALALERPDLVGELVALDAMGLGTDLASGRLTWLLARLQVANHISVRLMGNSRRYVEFGLAALAHEDFDVPAALVDLVQREARRPDAGAAFRRLRDGEITSSGYRTDYSDRLGDLDVPATFVHGDADDVFPVGWSERAADRAPEGALRVLEDCGHLGTWERPDHVAAIIANRC